MKTTDFAALVAQNYALDSVVALTVKARRVNAQTRDDHAAHAIEMLAARKGLLTLTTRPDDGSFVIGITGFGKNGGAR